MYLTLLQLPYTNFIINNNLFYLMVVPRVGIELTTDDYKSTALPNELTRHEIAFIFKLEIRQEFYNLNTRYVWNSITFDSFINFT